MIEVKNLCKTYGSTVAIQDLNFTVNHGEIVGFLGPNGAGKTTTMRILTGYTPATSGTAKIGGFEVHKHSLEVRRRVGYLPENPPLYLEMTVEGFLYFVATIKGLKLGDRPSRIKSVLQQCQLQEHRKTIIRKLSKGYRQRLGIAQAIVHNPRVIILDEPTTGLDPRQIIEMRNLIQSLGGKHTILLSSHILPEVSMICQRVIIINQGKLVATNTPDHLMKQLKSNFGYQMEVEGDINNLLPLLRNIPGVSGVEVNQLNHRYLLNVSCTSTTEPGGEIAALIIEQGLELYEMRRIQPCLEDIFLKLTTPDSRSKKGNRFK